MVNLNIAWVCVLTSCASVLHAEEMLLVADVAPFIYSQDGVPKGVLYEILHDVALRAGHSGTVHPVPIRRQAEWGRRNADTLTTLLYMPSRQFEYTWLFKLLDDRIVLVANANSKVDISSIETARDLRLGVILGGPPEIALRRLGFRHIEAVASLETNVRKLARGRIDAWAVAYGTFRHAQSHSQELRSWRTGAVLGQFSIYLGGPAGMDTERVRLWRTAFESAKRDGSYANILQTYHYTVPTGTAAELLPGD